MKRIELTNKKGVKISINTAHIIYFLEAEKPEYTLIKVAEEKEKPFSIKYDALVKLIEEAK